MDFEPIEKIANAVLYEGFLLYPYRRTSTKNQKRWHFGTLGPVGGGDPQLMQTQCLVRAASLDIKIRFLQEEIEREIVLERVAVGGPPEYCAIAFGELAGSVEVESELVNEQLYRVTVRIRNLSETCSMLSVHTMLAAHHGAFVSLLDPPEADRLAAAGCKNIGTWPVLAGREGEHTMLLSSPIILYDYPQIAPESPGDFFDGTEMDEMLTLRVLTLSDSEKQELREGDERGREILERTESLPPEQVAKLHGAIRGLRRSTQLQFREGDRVRLRPTKQADIFDIALAGMIAIVESVEHDFEGRVHLAVTIEDDPGREFGIARQIGHRFFFAPEEVELV